MLKCGNQADDFALGSCGFRWAALLAVIAFVDSIVLGEWAVLFTLSLFLAFCLDCCNLVKKWALGFKN